MVSHGTCGVTPLNLLPEVPGIYIYAGFECERQRLSGLRPAPLFAGVGRGRQTDARVCIGA